jgi:Glycosyl hydrolases family 16
VTSPRRRPLLPSLIGGILLTGAALAAAGLSAPAGTGANDPVDPAFASTCIGYCKHPTNAAKVFRWGVEAWRDEFEVPPFSSRWRSDRPRLIGQQSGMLTIKAYARTGSVTVWPDDQSAQYGRWEARVRAVEKKTDGERYRFTWQLVPVDGAHCGASEVTLASYRPGDKRARGWVRTLDNFDFRFSRKRDLRSRAWHTYAVEITPDHVSWFVDTRVVRTETRPEALSGATFRPQFVISGDPAAHMNASWMQMDWVRYYTLNRSSAKSIDAPQMNLQTYDGAC